MVSVPLQYRRKYSIAPARLTSGRGKSGRLRIDMAANGRGPEYLGYGKCHRDNTILPLAEER